MKGFIDDIEKLTKENNDFRRVIYTGQNSQLVLMSLLPGEDIGMEVHENADQFFRFEYGSGKMMIDGMEHVVHEEWAVIVPAGTEHDLINTGEKELKFYTIYSPPQHRDKVVHHTKEEANADSESEAFDGKTTE